MSEERDSLNIHSAKITFNRDSNYINIQIRPKKIGKPVNIPPFEIPEYIERGELEWRRFQGEIISVYIRKKQCDYSAFNISAHESLNQKLEMLLHESYRKYKK